MGFIAWFGIAVGIIIVIAVALFFASGIYHCRKGRIYIIERYNEYYKTLGPGWYYFMPIVYHRRAWYPSTTQVRTFTLENGITINLYYRIADARIYHYTAIRVYDRLMEIANANESLDEEMFKEGFAEIGLEFIKIERAGS